MFFCHTQSVTEFLTPGEIKDAWQMKKGFQEPNTNIVGRRTLEGLLDGNVNGKNSGF